MKMIIDEDDSSKGSPTFRNFSDFEFDRRVKRAYGPLLCNHLSNDE